MTAAAGRVGNSTVRPVSKIARLIRETDLPVGCAEATALPSLAGVRLGVVADVHGIDVALRAVLADAERFGVDRWWALGDLVLFGPRPVEVLEPLQGLPGLGMLQGNTDRYVLTGE
jgi:hypothetical protein